MGKFIWDMCEKIFGNGLINSVSTMINEVFTTLQTVINSNQALINWALAIAASLMVIYFFQSIIDQASRDMFSFLFKLFRKTHSYYCRYRKCNDINYSLDYMFIL